VSRGGGIGWLDQVGMLTGPHRESRARVLDAAAIKAQNEAIERDLPGAKSGSYGKWHRDRAKGQRRRIENVTDCRVTQKVVITCNGCGTINEEMGRCRVGLICVSCRGKIASEKRARFARARAKALNIGRSMGLLRSARRGGRWSEKMVTLTAPHAARHSVRERIMLVRTAWTHFLKSFNAFLRMKGAHGEAQWLRNIEWTPGSDGRGHPHIHVWFFGPFLPQGLLQAWWVEALADVGYHAEELEHVLPHVIAMRGTERDAHEVIKYIVKDIVADGSKVSPQVFAEVYKSLDGVRTTQGARGFLKLADRPEGRACACGALGCFTVRISALAPNAFAPKRSAPRELRTVLPTSSVCLAVAAPAFPLRR
jgi:hypothetical protein